MTTMRLRLAYDGERVADDEKQYKLQRDDVPATRMKLERDKMQFGGQLTHALTQLSYLVLVVCMHLFWVCVCLCVYVWLSYRRSALDNWLRLKYVYMSVI